MIWRARAGSFTWCDKEMLKASQEMGFGNAWRAALEKVNTQYHDAVLQAGSMPVELVRASITKQMLTPGHKTAWKFDGGLR